MDPLIVAFKVSLLGIGVVFFALVLIAGVISLLRRLESVETRAQQHDVAEDVPEEVVAVIAAAVTTALGKAAVVKRIRYGRHPLEHPWSQQGRVTIMASHTTRE